MKNYIIETERLGFRLWEERDYDLFAEMNSSDEVMKYLPNILTYEETMSFVDRINKHFEDNGYGLWAVELKEEKIFIGFIGFQIATFEAEFNPCVEIGWRLDNKYWNKGYATEGAKAILEYGFNVLGLSDICSFTAEINKPSENIMKKIGMKKQLEFNHPKLEDNSPLKKHILYKISKE